ncbi:MULTISPECIES: hypothetical protein [unclassified Rhizobium]|jgi:hypothetical protein|uniref:hypothetical protein n=1 Tax=unclassified Rhizobium TaxID=2613769 RepID=UPI0006466E50|nr:MULTISPECIES: hypothetical protein [unclassified Rhizobium]MBN8949684.1 hypothetical protein [Rhizobium tropici]OJY62910.1 MAG: hypothetical protein BGP09_17770 [Rhizobium sp. 60-20]RKD74982.1 hypothetical protein BJ928_1011341 [Rhizobium sp. WW_1]
MCIKSKFAIVALSLAVLMPATAFADNPLLPKPYVAPVYPYKDLPGVTAPKIMADEKFQCQTTTLYPDYWGGGLYYRGLPRLGYVCDQNGVISSSTRKPNYQYWQYNGPDR